MGAIGTKPRPIRLAVVGLRGMPNVIGGIETHCALLYPSLVRTMPELDVTVLVKRRYVPARYFRYLGVDVRALWAPKVGGAEAAIHTVLALLYARLTLHATVVHLHGIGPAFFTLLARLLGMRVVVTHHAADFLRPKWSPFARLFLRTGEWMAGRFADTVVCVSDAVAQEFAERVPGPSARVLTIRHMVRLSPDSKTTRTGLLDRLGLTDGGYVIAVGRLEETKRFEDVLIAHRAIGDAALPLVIVGAGQQPDDSYETYLRTLAGPRVIFAGFRSGVELSALYHGAAALLHPSAMEGFGLVILEGLSAGVPVFVSDIPVHREFRLPDTQYFPVGNVAAIGRILAAIPVRDAAWPAAAAIVARHDMLHAVGAHAAMFRALIQPVTRHQSMRMTGAMQDSKADQ